MNHLPRSIALLGSTGSIGTNTLDVVAHLGPAFRLDTLTADRRWEELARQARLALPRRVVLSSADAGPLRKALEDLPIEVLQGPDALVQVAEDPQVDLVVAAVVGAAGMPPVLAAAKAGKLIALANKEALVVAGSLVIPQAKRSGATLLPVDSEHSAVYQALRSGQSSEIAKIILTASGGPFRTWPASRIAQATREEALAHPNWKMGPKITIDSATMMNKALEIIEAHWLFDLPAEKIEVVIHPQSIIHSMIEFVDGSVIAQLGTPDMRTPIQYALTHPQRCPGCSTRLDWKQLREMTFEQPDERFPALELGYQVIRMGGTSGAVVNAANEKANQRFREGKITFGQIVPSVQRVLERHRQKGFVASPSLNDLLDADAWARQEIDYLC